MHINFKSNIISVGSLKTIEEKFKMNHTIKGSKTKELAFKNNHFLVELFIKAGYLRKKIKELQKKMKIK